MTELPGWPNVCHSPTTLEIRTAAINRFMSARQYPQGIVPSGVASTPSTSPHDVALLLVGVPEREFQLNAHEQEAHQRSLRCCSAR
jgi:hypothetical protein